MIINIFYLLVIVGILLLIAKPWREGDVPTLIGPEESPLKLYKLTNSEGESEYIYSSKDIRILLKELDELAYNA